MTFCPSRRH